MSSRDKPGWITQITFLITFLSRPGQRGMTGEMENKMDKKLNELYKKAKDIAGAILEDVHTEGLLSKRISDCAEWINMGTDGDLSPTDRKALRLLAKEAAEAEGE